MYIYAYISNSCIYVHSNFRNTFLMNNTTDFHTGTLLLVKFHRLKHQQLSRCVDGGGGQKSVYLAVNYVSW